MKSSKQISMNRKEIMRLELEVLRSEHRDLDSVIEKLVEGDNFDQLTITRLKKRKLRLKDKIFFIEDQLTPDIIA